MNITVTLHFPKGYIGNPYWPEMERVISIRKASGVDRARSGAKRALALKSWLEAHGMTMDEYKALELRAGRPFQTAPDGEILISAHHMHGFTAATAAVAPAAIRLAKPEQIRTLIEWGDLRTGKYKADETWERFVRNPLTNQRRYQANEVITDVTATGMLRLVNPDVERKAREFVAFGGREIGVGASRKMGWGRFEIAEWVAR